jgi:Domain of unknown function (DUF5050)
MSEDDAALYVSHQFRDIVRIPKDGSPAKILPGTTEPTGLVVDGELIFYANGDSLLSIPKTGGKPTHLADATLPLQVATDADRVYWTDLGLGQKPADGGGVYSAKKDGSDLVRLDDRPETSGMAVGPGLVYFAVVGKPDTLQAAPKRGGSRKTLDSSTTIGPALVDGSVLFWTRAKAGGSGKLTELVRGGLDGSSIEVVAEATASLFTIGSDDACIYAATENTLLRVSKDGGRFEKIADTNGVFDMRIDADAVYWSEFEKGRVVRLAK